MEEANLFIGWLRKNSAQRVCKMRRMILPFNGHHQTQVKILTKDLSHEEKQAHKLLKHANTT